MARRQLPFEIPLKKGMEQPIETREFPWIPSPSTIAADFALWAIERAKLVVSEEGTALALAARGMDDEIGVAGNALGQAIADAMLEVFDGLMNGVAED
jgi:hypothetical protein